MMISYGCVYKRSSKPVMKGSRVETVEAARKEYKQLLDEGWKRLVSLGLISSYNGRANLQSIPKLYKSSPIPRPQRF